MSLNLENFPGNNIALTDARKLLMEAIPELVKNSLVIAFTARANSIEFNRDKTISKENLLRLYKLLRDHNNWVEGEPGMRPSPERIIPG